MKRTAWIVAGIALLTCAHLGGRLPLPGESHQGLSQARAEDSIDLILDFRGLVAFLPQGPGSGGYQIDKPMGESGTVKSIVALLPRADDPSVLNDEEIPEPLDFAHHGSPHALHFAALRVPVAHVGGSGSGSFLLPLPGNIGSGIRPTYSVKLSSTQDADSDVSYEQMDQVARVVEGTGTPLSAVPGPADSKADKTAFVASVVLNKGEKLTASEDPESSHSTHSRSAESNTWEYTYERCMNGSPGAQCRHVSTKIGDMKLASQAQAIRSVPASARVLLVVTEYVKGKVTGETTIPLTQVKGRVVVRVESGPAPELFPNTSGGAELAAFEHFKLFHLLALRRLGTYYFPELSKIQIEPYCTPLAQFVQKPR